MTFKQKIAGIISALFVLAFIFIVGQNIKLFNSSAAVSVPSIQTSLEWHSSDYAKKTDWNTATAYCANLPTDTGIYRNVSWRLPTINELMITHSNGSTSAPVFKNWFYWSSTEFSTSTASSSFAYDFDMTSTLSSSQTFFKKTLSDDYARCVRNITITAPDAPTDIYAQVGDRQAIISFTPPTVNQYSDIYYTVTSNPDNITATGSSTPIIITGLTNGAAYTFTVTATNIAGTSTDSIPSNQIAPEAKILKLSGTGKPSTVGTYYITSWTDLDNLRNVLGTQYYNFILTKNLSSTTPGYSGLGDNWTPIGTDLSNFTGNFNGANYTISDLVINKPTTDNVGLFSTLTGSIYNLGLVNVNITGHSYTGGITGRQYGGLITNSYVKGLITNSVSSVGGLVGDQSASSSITNSYSTANINGNASGLVGGLVGGSSGTISNSYATGNVIGYSYVGGLVGGSSGTISNSYSIGLVQGSISFGGLAGSYSGPSTNSYWDTQTSGQPTSAAGTGKLTSEMKTASTYNWDTGIWNIADGFYPSLIVTNDFVFLPPPIPAFAHGTGILGDPYQVSSWSELNNVRNDLTAYYKLTTDLSSLTSGYYGVGDNFNPIGVSSSNSFAGNFDGNNHTISDLVINKTSAYVGLFSSLTGNVNNLGLINVSITGRGSVGGLTGKQFSGTVSNSYVTGTINNSLSSYAGGFIGYQNTGAIVSGSHFIGTTTSSASYIGGLIGYSNSGTISQSYSAGVVSGGNGTQYVGGLVGYVQPGTISNSYSTASVTSGLGSANTGGLIGGRGNTATISSCYSIGRVVGVTNVGGLVGQKGGSSPAMNDSYWDTQTSLQPTSVGGGVAKLTSEMKTASTYTGWNLGIWNIVDGSYPTLY